MRIRAMLFLTGPLLLAMLVAVVLPLAQSTRSTAVAAPAKAAAAPIDGERAYKYLKEICAIGPRPAGSAANARQRAMVAAHFRKMGGLVREQPFSGIDPKSGARVAMANLVGSWSPERTDRVLLGVHYDTRPFPDEERDPSRRTIPFIGANDGASGVALLMEIAHHLNDLPTPWGVDLVLFDGEELVYGREGEYFLGSKEFARVYATAPGKSRYAAGLVLDMVGGRDLKIKQEQHSLQFAQRLVQDVWSVARRLKATGFREQVGVAVMDDHLALNYNGIPAIDIIDFDYPHWHTSHDLPENCSAASLEQVGRVVTTWLAQPKPRRR
jgi:glutaminyl-peptide cyclotransferase